VYCCLAEYKKKAVRTRHTVLPLLVLYVLLLSASFCISLHESAESFAIVHEFDGSFRTRIVEPGELPSSVGQELLREKDLQARRNAVGLSVESVEVEVTFLSCRHEDVPFELCPSAGIGVSDNVLSHWRRLVKGAAAAKPTG